MGEPIRKVDLHGLMREDAIKRIEKELAGADSGTYRIELIHGFHRGTSLKDMIREEYAYDPRIKRVAPGDNMGITVLVLRDF